jgi:hypothetical protein
VLLRVMGARAVMVMGTMRSALALTLGTLVALPTLMVHDPP